MTTCIPQRRFRVEPLEERVVPTNFVAVFARAAVGGGAVDVQVTTGPGLSVRLNANVAAGLSSAFSQGVVIQV